MWGRPLICSWWNGQRRAPETGLNSPCRRPPSNSGQGTRSRSPSPSGKFPLGRRTTVWSSRCAPYRLRTRRSAIHWTSPSILLWPKRNSPCWSTSPLRLPVALFSVQSWSPTRGTPRTRSASPRSARTVDWTLRSPSVLGYPQPRLAGPAWLPTMHRPVNRPFRSVRSVPCGATSSSNRSPFTRSKRIGRAMLGLH